MYFLTFEFNFTTHLLYHLLKFIPIGFYSFLLSLFHYLFDNGNRVDIVIIGTFCLSGKLNVDKLRLKLDGAMKKNDPDLLEKVIADCVSSGHVELIPDIQEARLRLESLVESGRGSSLSLTPILIFSLSLNLVFPKSIYKTYISSYV